VAFDAYGAQEILSFLERAVAAGVGAWAAFRLHAAREARKEQADRAQALREALFVLAAQRSALLSLDNGYLDEVRRDPERHLRLHPPAVAAGASQALDFTKLGFLVSIKDSDLLSRLDFAEVQFRMATAALAERSAIHLRLQERLAASGAEYGPINSDSISAIVGRDVVLQLKGTTDALYQYVDAALDSNRTCLDAVQQVMREEFPRERVPRVIEDEKKKG